MRNLRTFIALAVCAACAASGARASRLVDRNEHPNFEAQLPTSTPETYVTVEELSREAPQSDFSFNGYLVGYIDRTNPARAVIWAPLVSSIVFPPPEQVEAAWPSAPPSYTESQQLQTQGPLSGVPVLIWNPVSFPGTTYTPAPDPSTPPNSGSLWIRLLPTALEEPASEEQPPAVSHLPEPATFALVGGGLLVLHIARDRRQ